MNNDDVCVWIIEIKYNVMYFLMFNVFIKCINVFKKYIINIIDKIIWVIFW